MLRREKRETDRIKDKFTVMSSEQVDQLLSQIANGGHTSEADQPAAKSLSLTK
jgi:hypothetical protein